MRPAVQRLDGCEQVVRVALSPDAPEHPYETVRLARVKKIMTGDVAPLVDRAIDGRLRYSAAEERFQATVKWLMVGFGMALFALVSWAVTTVLKS